MRISIHPHRHLLHAFCSSDETHLGDISKTLRLHLTRPTMLILTGQVGAGKTTLARAFAEGKTWSPTYSLVSEGEEIVHADLYRIDSPDELIHLELSLYLEEKKHLFVEWGRDHIVDLWRSIPGDYAMMELDIQFASPSSRHYVLYNLELQE